MKNIQIVDNGENAVYDIFQATQSEFDVIFPDGTDIAFIEEVYARRSETELNPLFAKIWDRRIAKKDAMGIHGLLYYQMEFKKQFYPTRRDEEAINPGGWLLRQK